MSKVNINCCLYTDYKQIYLQDIRSFFSVISKKANQSGTVSTKKRAIVIDSSDDEVIEASPVQAKKTIAINTKKRKIIDSDSDGENKGGKVNATSAKNEKNTKMRKVNAADVFGSTPVKQAKVEKKEHSTSNDNIKKESHNKDKNKKKTEKLETELGIHDDPAFEQSLLDLDNDILLDNVNVLDKTIEEALNASTSMSMGRNEKATPKNKRKIEEDDDTGMDKDQERHEKRRHSAMLYQKYLNRSGPAHYGAKEYPKVV